MNLLPLRLVHRFSEAILRFPKLGPQQRAVSPWLTLALAWVGTVGPVHSQYGAIGLSAMGGQRFANEDLLFFEPQASDHFGRTLAAGDFNGDGAMDLATGMPHDNGITGFEMDDCGGVVIRYGVSGQGLASGLASTLLNQVSGSFTVPAQAGDNYGGALAACDFNTDGFDDLAVGIPNKDISGSNDAGAVEIVYGGPGGLAGDRELLSQATTGVPGDPEVSEFFGFSLACGDFNGDGFADLAIGVPWESVDDEFSFRAGVVEVVFGSVGGLDQATTRLLSQNDPLLEDDSEDNDQFGWALAAGNFDSDDSDDLAVGVRGENGTSISTGRGAVQVIFGDTSPGLLFTADRLFTETDLGGTAEDGDQLGFTLAAGDFNGDLFDDLAVGIPFEDLPGAVDAGQVVLIYFRPCCPGPSFVFWSETLIHGAGTSETGDRFSFSLASGDFDRDGFDDVVIGAPGEFQNVQQDGAVNVIMGSAIGATGARRHGLAAGFHGNPGVQNQPNRNFGFAVATGDFDGDGYSDLAIGAPNEDENGIADVGATVVLYGSLFSDGFAVGNPGFWSSTSP